MKEICPVCNAKTILPKPGKFSPADTYGRERRIAKKLEEEKE
jgi:rRNA maturation protein Nop10